MADESADGDLERSGQGWVDEDTFYAMESLQATLQHFEAVLRQRDISEASSSEYCDNFCQVKTNKKQKHEIKPTRGAEKRRIVSPPAAARGLGLAH